MKRLNSLLAIGSLVFIATARLHSRAEVARTPVQTLQLMKEANQKLIDQQAAALGKLDEIAKSAQQLRTFSKRS